MKKHISLTLLFSFALSIVQSAQAFSLRERAQKLKKQTTALVAKPKKWWYKIAFTKQALLEARSATQELESCQKQHGCSDETCLNQHCDIQIKQLNKASAKLVGALEELGVTFSRVDGKIVSAQYPLAQYSL